MSVLRSLRRNPFFNRLFRSLLRNRLRFWKRFLGRWPVSGNVPLALNGISFRLYSRADDYLASTIYYGTWFEEHDHRAFMLLSQYSEHVLDIGANNGTYSITACLHAPRVTAHAFEPHPANIARLQRNIALNGLQNRVNVIAKALSHTAGTLPMWVEDPNGITDVASLNLSAENFGPHSRNRFKVDVDVIRLDELVAQGVVPPFQLVKLDVEGHEPEVLEGFGDYLDSHSPVIMFECVLSRQDMMRIAAGTSNSRLEEVVEFFRAKGYHFYLALDVLLRRTHDPISTGVMNIFASKYESPTPYLPFNEAAKWAPQFLGLK
jgi:FkbM family methyltransferase